MSRPCRRCTGAAQCCGAAKVSPGCWALSSRTSAAPASSADQASGSGSFLPAARRVLACSRWIARASDLKARDALPARRRAAKRQGRHQPLPLRDRVATGKSRDHAAARPAGGRADLLPLSISPRVPTLVDGWKAGQRPDRSRLSSWPATIFDTSILFTPSSPARLRRLHRRPRGVSLRAPAGVL